MSTLEEQDAQRKEQERQQREDLMREQWGHLIGRVLTQEDIKTLSESLSMNNEQRRYKKNAMEAEAMKQLQQQQQQQPRQM